MSIGWHCRSIWDYDDFSACFRENYLQIAYPAVFITVTFLYLAPKSVGQLWARRASRPPWKHYAPLARDAADVESDEDDDNDDPLPNGAPNVFATIEEGPNIEESLDQPLFQRTVVAAELLCSLANVGLLAGRAVLEHDSRHVWPLPRIFLAVYWTYTSTLVCLRVLFPRVRSDPIASMWATTALLYTAAWPVQVFLFRTTIVHDQSTYDQLSMGLVALFSTVLLAIALCSRPGNKPVKQVSVDGLIPSQEPLASIASSFLYMWVNPLLVRGYKSAIRMEDVYDMKHEDHAQQLLASFHTVKASASLTTTFLRFLLPMLLQQAFWAILASITMFTPTLFLQQILLYVENPNHVPESVAWLFVIGLFVGTASTTIFSGRALYIGRQISVKLRSIVIGEVYAKALRRRDVSAAGGAAISDEDSSGEKPLGEGQANNGAIINLMAIDAFKVADVSAYLHFLIAQGPTELIVAMALLYRVLGWPAITGILSTLLLMPINYYVSHRFGKIQKDLMAVTDKRINKMNEILSSVRVIKFFAWEENFIDDINGTRSQELTQLRRRFVLWSFAGLLWNGSPVLISMVTFGTYTLIAKQTLTPSVAFTALSLFEILRAPLEALADMITNVLQSKVSIDRVQAFLYEEETQKYRTLAAPRGPDDPVIGFKNASFSWASEEETQKSISTNSVLSSFQLRDLNVNFPVTGYTVIVGPTGSGKTSMLTALLGEMTPITGSSFLPGARDRDELIPDPRSGLIDAVAYCPQQPWLLNDTIRNNIIFGGQWDVNRYNDVIKASALERDLSILEAGDQTEIGEKGITLSGGQKQRVSLARAIYSNAKHILLDDCLSAVDSHSAEWIFNHCIVGRFMEDRTRILVSHNVHLTLPLADHVIVMENGRISAQGVPSDVMASGAVAKNDEILQGAISRASSRGPSRIPSAEQITDIVEDQEGIKSDGKLTKKQEDRKANAGKLVQEEERSEGAVNWDVYKIYFKSLGGLKFWIILVFVYVAQQLTYVSTSWWLRQWANSTAEQAVSKMLTFARSESVSQVGTKFSWNNVARNGFQVSSANEGIHQLVSNPDVAYYMSVYSFLSLLYCISSLCRYLFVFWGSLTSSKNLHSSLVHHMLGASVRFFDSTPAGRIMNRFSKDLEVIDQEIALVIMSFASDALNILTIVVLITVVTPGFLVGIVVIAGIYYMIGIYYLRTSRELKRLESVTRSPIYQHFGESLVGVSTIRAYGMEKRFIRHNLANIDKNNRPYFFNWVSNRWLSIRVDMAGALVSFSAGALILLSLDRIDAGLAGLSLSYAVSFTGHMLWIVRLYALNEMNMNSVERIREYLSVPQEAPATVEGNRPPSDWPTKGEISIENLELQYAPDLPKVIKGISLHIPASCKIGIVGRTGAGKSTIATAFFRLLEPSSGRILIDGKDVTTIGLKDLRRALTIIPQDPTLFQRTVRYNLDPFGSFSDRAMFDALKAVHLVTDEELANPEQYNGPDVVNPNIFLSLDSPISEGGGNLSQGQKQLMCLARSLLKRTKVIVMDESTASVDTEIQNRIQNTVLGEYGESTVLTIAHRLSTIIGYDRILVLVDGRVAEYDSPYTLLQSDTIFADMCKTSGEYEVFKAMLSRKQVNGTSSVQ